MLKFFIKKKGLQINNPQTHFYNFNLKESILLLLVTLHKLLAIDSEHLLVLVDTDRV